MPNTTYTLPILPTDRPLRLTPTDVSQFVRLEQCERFLRFRLAERAKQKFMEDYDVNPQRITPLLTLLGGEFEECVEKEIRDKNSSRVRIINYSEVSSAHDRSDNNKEVSDEARSLKRRHVLLLFQPRLKAELEGWQLRGDVDLLLLERTADGTLHVLITDLKSSIEAKVEHRLQVAFYRLMLEWLLRNAGIDHAPVETGILFRPPVDPTPDEEKEIKSLREAARKVFGLKDSLLEIVADPEAYIQSAYDLLLGKDSTARRVASTSFEAIPYCLSFKCDGCLYNEFCMKWSAEQEDLSLLPHMTGTDKEALRRVGIITVQSLATLKDFAAPTGGGNTTELVSAPGREDQVKKIAASWSVGPRLDELIHRAKSFCRSVRKDGTHTLSYIPGKGNSTLPVCHPDLNPNLVWVYLDAQLDYREGRVYLLGARVVACKDGSKAAERAVVHMTDGPPDSAAVERQLFMGWTRELAQAVVDLAVSSAPPGEKKSAPIHVVFFNSHEQRVMLEALARNFSPILDKTPPLYDFLTQLAAFDSPIASFLDEELRTFKNFPMTCQSLQSVATYLKFDWNTPQPFRDLFKARLFDYLGRLDIDGVSEWFTRRSRFSSSIPLEYAYAAWDQLPKPEKGKGDVFADFRAVTKEKDMLTAFQERRLEALEHIANRIQGNPNTQKSAFVLPNLIDYEDRAHDLAHALDEFITIERLVALNDWKAMRHAPPERRVLMGDCLLVRYDEADQEPGVAEQNRENRRHYEKRQEYEAAFKTAHPDEPIKLTREQNSECKWSPNDLRVKLRLESAGVDCGLEEVLALSNLRKDDRLVLYSRLTVDERLPVTEQKKFTPTPKQMLYGQRANLGPVVTEKDASGHVQAALAEVVLRDAFGGKGFKPFVFGAFNVRPLEDGKLYTLDPCPDDWYGYWLKQVVKGLCAKEPAPNVLYDRLVTFPPPGNGSGSPGQEAFLAGLDAFREAGLLHDFEESKRELIGSHSTTPILLVQGPPGTGKSYSTAFAVFARLQGTMREERPYRIFLSCKTHAATDVLLKNVLEVQATLRKLRDEKPRLFRKHFDARLLDVPLFRIAPHDEPPPGIVHLRKDDERDDDEDYNADEILKPEWAVVGITPGGIYGILKKKWQKTVFGHELFDLLVLDEASQMNLPEALMAALPMRPDAPLIVVGDHRQMPPIVKHDWDGEARRTFREYQVYESLFDYLRDKKPPMIQFAESFRLHAAMAEFLKEEIYCKDHIDFHSKKHDQLRACPVADDLAKAVLHPDYPLIVVEHNENESQMRNVFEQVVMEPIIRALADKSMYGLDAVKGLGIVVPHRAQRAALQLSFPHLSSAIDTVERFQGGERTVILVSATESDRAYLLASSGFLLNPRRLTVALSRAKVKMILVASRSIFSLFSPDEETFDNTRMWKNLLLRACPELLWDGERDGRRVAVRGGKTGGTTETLT